MPSETSAVNAAYIEARMKQFKLVDMREQYQELIRVASEQSMTYEDFLIMLLQAEETGKKRRQAERLTDAANFDSDKRLSDIDYRFNPNLDADKIQSLGRLEFIFSASVSGVGVTETCTFASSFSACVSTAGVTVIATERNSARKRFEFLFISFSSILPIIL